MSGETQKPNESAWKSDARERGYLSQDDKVEQPIAFDAATEEGKVRDKIDQLRKEMKSTEEAARIAAMDGDEISAKRLDYSAAETYQDLKTEHAKAKHIGDSVVEKQVKRDLHEELVGKYQEVPSGELEDAHSRLTDLAKEALVEISTLDKYSKEYALGKEKADRIILEIRAIEEIAARRNKE